MKTRLNLEKYLQLGGKLDKIKIEEFFFIGRNDLLINKKILKVEDKGDTNKWGGRMVSVTFKDVDSARSLWVGNLEVRAEIKLGKQYK